MTTRVAKTHLEVCYNVENRFEIGIDEAGRGPMFGRIYVACVILPKQANAFQHERMCDSKKIKSKKKMAELAKYIKENSIAYNVDYMEADVIDQHNILRANMMCMHRCVRKMLLGTVERRFTGNIEDYMLLVDGNYFTPFTIYDENSETIHAFRHECIEKGDAKYTSIAAASILAKYERDTYIERLCEEYPDLKEKYGIHTNMGYGTKIHMDGIREYGITQWHRKSFGLCKEARYNPL